MYEVIRQAVTSHIITSRDTLHADWPLVFKNDPFDWSNPPAFFVYVDVDFTGASQLGSALNPKSREAGLVSCTIYCKDGTGPAKAGAALTWLKQTLEYQIFSPAGARVTFKEFRPAGGEPYRGWYRTHANAIFHADPA